MAPDCCDYVIEQSMTSARPNFGEPQVRKAPRTAFYFTQSAMTGFIASALLSRNRVSLKEAFEGLELCERKLSCTVLRGLDGSNPVRLLGFTGPNSPRNNSSPF